MAEKKILILHDHKAGIIAKHLIYSKWSICISSPGFCWHLFTRVTHIEVRKSSILIPWPESKRKSFFVLAVPSFWQSFSLLALVASCILLLPSLLRSFTFSELWSFLSAGLGGPICTVAGAGITEGDWKVRFRCWCPEILLLFWPKLSTGRFCVPCPSGVLEEWELAVWGGLEVGRNVGGIGRGAGVAAAGRRGGCSGGGVAVVLSLEASKRLLHDGCIRLFRWDILCFLVIRGLLKLEFKTHFCNNKKKIIKICRIKVCSCSEKGAFLNRQLLKTLLSYLKIAVKQGSIAAKHTVYFTQFLILRFRKLFFKSTAERLWEKASSAALSKASPKRLG